MPPVNHLLPIPWTSNEGEVKPIKKVLPDFAKTPMNKDGT